MDRHEAWLKPWIEDGILDGEQHHDPKQWKNHVLGQCKSWIDGGLQARAMTRDLDWGVKVPLEGADGKVLYVWLDAPIGYISATRQWAADHGKDWEPYWKDKDTKLVHFIGKDNIVFHCIIFPILLKAHGDYVLPTNVPANAFLNLEGEKLSTSRNWAVWVLEYFNDFPDKADELRYTLNSIAPESRDSEFTWKGWVDRVNNELVAKYGNFVNRSLVLTNKYFEGKVPERGALEAIDQEVLAAAAAAPEKIGALIEQYRFREAQAEAMKLAEAGNKYLADTEPWKLIKTDEGRVKTIMNIALQMTANLAIVFEPFIPFSSHKLWDMLNLTPLVWADAGRDDLLTANHALNKPALLFSKLEDSIIEDQRKKMEASKITPTASATTAKPAKPEITFDDFTKLDIRVGEVLAAEKVEKADKLLKLTINTGVDTRTVVSGIAEHYTPEEVVGKKVSVLINLAPRKIRGVESQGMILMAENEAGELAFVAPTKDFPGGSEVS